MFTAIQEVYDWIYQHSPVNDLHKFNLFLEELGHPERRLKTIHVAGTNGKGSTVSYLASILKEANYKVGTFTTPYLHVLNDRMKVNGEMILDSFIIQTINQYAKLMDQYQLSFHEIDMFIATLFFIDQKVDIAIYEVGLGGSKDATNVIYPIISIITNIGKDHMEYLGSTYESIAKEKAGIIKEKIPLYTSETKKECLNVFKKICLSKNTMMTLVSNQNYQNHGNYLSFKADDKTIHISTLASYQIKNASLVYECVLYLRNQGYLKISDEAMIQGFWKARWPGRFEVISHQPFVIIDGAHNLEGIEAFVESAQNYKDSQILFSALKDKEIDLMLSRLLSLSRHITLTSFEDGRIASLKEVSLKMELDYIEDFKEAIDMLMKKNNTILVVGSLHFISKVRAYVFDKKGESTISRSMYGK